MWRVVGVGGGRRPPHRYDCLQHWVLYLGLDNGWHTVGHLSTVCAHWHGHGEQGIPPPLSPLPNLRVRPNEIVPGSHFWGSTIWFFPLLPNPKTVRPRFHSSRRGGSLRTDAGCLHLTLRYWPCCPVVGLCQPLFYSQNTGFWLIGQSCKKVSPPLPLPKSKNSCGVKTVWVIVHPEWLSHTPVLTLIHSEGEGGAQTPSEWTGSCWQIDQIRLQPRWCGPSCGHLQQTLNISGPVYSWTGPSTQTHPAGVCSWLFGFLHQCPKNVPAFVRLSPSVTWFIPWNSLSLVCERRLLWI